MCWGEQQGPLDEGKEEVIQYIKKMKKWRFSFDRLLAQHTGSRNCCSWTMVPACTKNTATVKRKCTLLLSGFTYPDMIKKNNNKICRWVQLGNTCHITWCCCLFIKIQAKIQKEPKPSPLHHCALQLVWGVCANVLCLVFATCGEQISPVWLHPARLAVCSRFAATVFLGRRHFILAALLNKSYYFSLFSSCDVMNFNISAEACRAWDVAPGFCWPRCISFALWQLW